MALDTDRPARIGIIANPTSGRGRGRELIAPLSCALQRRGYAVAVRQTRSGGDAEEAARELGPRARALVVIGGDGTINEVCSGNLEARCPIAVVPQGTANLLARELGLPWYVPGLTQLLDAPALRWLDLIRIEQAEGVRWCAALASAGIDAAVVGAVSQNRRGPIHFTRYIRPLASQLLRYRAHALEVVLDGRPLSGAALGGPPTYCLVTHQRFYSGPFVVAPRAGPDSGRLTVGLMRIPTRRRAAELTARIYLGLLREGLDIERHEGQCVELRGEAPVQVDGDPASRLPMRCEVVPRCVPFVVPPALQAS